MTESDDAAELLFFDTFSHEVDTDINLDLVQFPKPVYITQVRIIPLGARVQADFPGGVRLGATNPSKFDIEFFVNDLGMPGASTFENLGQLKYNQNDCIHLECTLEKIPTDGLVLRGWYSTITLAVYGILTNSLNEPIASPPPPPCEPAGPEEICNLNATAAVEGRDAGLVEENIKEDWKEPLPGEAPHVHKNPTNIDFEREDLEYSMSSREHYHHLSGDERERERERDRRLRKTSRSSERSASSRNRTHSESNERDYMRGRTDRGCDRERERDRDREREKSTREWSRSPEYSRRARRKRSERSRSDAEETHKWPRTPPASIDSPLRPRSPDTMEYAVEDAEEDGRYKSKASLPLTHVYRRSSNESIDNTVTETIEDDEAIVGDQFEPILSDDEIIGDDDSEQAIVNEFEMEVDAAAATAGPAIEQFNPFTTSILRYVGDLGVYYQKDVDALQAILRKFESHFKCENEEIFRAATTTVEDRENFVHLTEQLINQLACLGQKFQQRNYVLQQCFRDKKENCEQAYRALRISLDFESACSQPQPTFKIRHMKAGARLAELLGSSPEFVIYLLQIEKFDPFEAVFALYRQEYMALSIKLMLLRSIYGLLDTKVGLQHFLNGKVNGYQLLLEMLQVTHLTRVKYALRAIIKKLHLHEALEYVREQCTKLFVLSNYKCDEPERGFAVIEHALRQIVDALAINALSYQQLKRFLPVCKKFEIVPDLVAERNFANALQTYFKKHSLAESLLLLLSNCEDLPRSLMLRILDVLQALLRTHVGVDYLVDDCFGTTRLLVAVLLGVEDLPGEEIVGIKAEKEGAVENIKTEQIGPNVTVEAVTVKIEKTDTDSEQPVESTEKALPLDAVDATEKGVSTPTTDAGSATTDVVDEVVPITTTIQSTATIESFKPSNLNRMQKLGVELAYKTQTRYHLDAIVYVSESSNYDGFKLTEHLHALYSQTCNAIGRQHTVDVLGMNNNLKVCMQLIKHEQRLQVQRQMSMPGSKYKSPVLSYAVDMLDCCVRYCESLDYLLAHGASILELAKNHETFEPSVSAVLQEMSVYLKPVEAINLFACGDIMPLVDVITRSLEYITTFPGDLIMGLRILRHLTIGVENKALKSTDTEELKYRFVTLQFYSADGMQILMQVLEKLCAYFEQPGLHTPALMTLQGVHCCQIVLSTLQILRAMLTYAIQCRDVEFKDLTAIDHLMKTYFLLHYFPAASQAAPDVELAKQEIIKILLAYTQPNEQDEESLHKSLWTQMIREVLKNIDGPATFIPGLLVLAELLPLPLPIPVHRSRQPPENHAQRLISERKLWSAHLHAQSAQIAKLIETIAPTSFPQLSDLLVKVCLQLADLAPNMTLLISKTLSDMLHGEWIASGSKPNLLLGRLLTFLGSLTAHPALKSSAMSMLLGSLWEVFQSILLQTENTPVVRKCQFAVQEILASFLDVNISLVSEQANKAIDLNLASSLPPYELMSNIAETLLNNLFNADLTSEMPILALRNLTKLTEHDIPFQNLSQQLKQKSNEFQQWMQKLSTSHKSENQLAVVESALRLMQGLTRIEQIADHPKTLPMRTLKLSPIEMAAVIGFQKDINQANPLLCLRAICEHHMGEMTTTTLLGDIDRLNSQVVVALEGNTTTPLEVNEDTSCMHEELPQAESIVMQYVGRPIFKEYDPDSDSGKLTSDYWLKPLCLDALTTEDFETKYERVTCDLTELASNCLSPETNLSSDCKRVLHLAASPQSNRERTPTAPCFRTRRVEVEPSTGRPEKKLYITPVRGRGFPRPPPSRGDIFRSRPPNTSRPPSLHVDDFLALETCGAQPTGPTGYNKIPPLMRGSRVGRNRGSRISAVAAYRKSKLLRTSSPSMWTSESISAHYRSATSEPHFGETHYTSSSPYGGRPRGRGNRSRIFMR